ncbi:hypothetical protein [Stenotrophomonas maltophilia]|uniref:hypothetical protein n=1 Tax=Stenotrophomonas maltophilia TaxID=40324 RepID=UPI0021B31A3C|nr:hypothetical protein [Stenotrophomonas maltophilia]
MAWIGHRLKVHPGDLCAKHAGNCFEDCRLHCRCGASVGDPLVHPSANVSSCSLVCEIGVAFACPSPDFPHVHDLVMVDGKEDREHYFFDTESFYLRRGPVPTAVPLSQITSVTRTSDRIYGRYVWQVCFSKASGRKCVTFTNNLTLFNRDFLLFLEAVRKANPLATVDRAGIRF